ncbi:hypothetical protein [Sphingomonas sp. RS2018]
MGRVVASVVGLAGVAVGGCMGTAPTGFADIAARGEAVAVTVPLWMNGELRVAADGVGRVSRRAAGREEAVGVFGAVAVTERTVDRYGRMHFDVTGAGVGGQLSGDCTYNRREARLEGWAVTISEPVEPLRLRCTFARDGAGIGSLTLDGMVERDGVTTLTRRLGEARVGGAAIDLRSMHRIGDGRGLTVDTPVGYTFVDRGGRTIGGVNINGTRRRDLVLPAGPERGAALAAGIVLSVFWDPEDTDD